MQSVVLWDKPELAVDSERSWSSGNRDPVDSICPIILTFFGQRRVPTSRFGEINQNDRSRKIHVFMFDYAFKDGQRW